MSSLWEKPGSIAATLWETGNPGFPIYDVHGHMGPHYSIYLKRCEAADMTAHLRRIGVKRLVFSHHAALFGTMRNAEVCKICREYPDLLRMYVAINPHYPERIREDLADFDRWAPYAVGLKLLPEYHQIPVTDAKYEYALKFADERGLPVLVHTWGGSPYDGGELALEMVRRYPRVKFLLGHSIYGEWEMAARCVKESAGNVYLELTAIPGDRGNVEKLVSLVGSEKLLFGTDLPWFDEYQAVGGVVSAAIGEDDIRNILYRNAERIFGKDF